MQKPKAKGKITTRKSGKGEYDSAWIYIPSKVFNDISFPFSDKEEVMVEVQKDGSLLIRKSDILIDIINEYGIENATLPKLIEKKAKENGNHKFLYYKDEIYTFKDINQQSNQIAHALIALKKELKLKKRPKVSIILPNCPDFIFCWFGVAKAGGIFSPINTELRGDLLKYVLDNNDTQILIIDSQYLTNFEEIKSQLPKIKKVFIMHAPKAYVFNENILDYSKIFNSHTNNPNIVVKDWHPMEILYTFGTTGNPKGVIWRNYLVLTGINVGKELVKIGLSKSDIIYCPVPLYHGIGQIISVLTAMFYEASIVITEKFDPQAFWDDVRRYNITAFIYYWNILESLLEQPPDKLDKEHSIRWVFGFGASKDTWEVFEKRFNVSIYEGWTLTEAVGITINTMGSKGGKIGSVGTSVSGYEFKIVDEEGILLPPGPENVGEIVSRSTFPIPLGYYGKTKWKEERNRWFHSGDLGYVDDDGFLYYMGRKE